MAPAGEHPCTSGATAIPPALTPTRIRLPANGLPEPVAAIRARRIGRQPDRRCVTTEHAAHDVANRESAAKGQAAPSRHMTGTSIADSIVIPDTGIIPETPV